MKCDMVRSHKIAKVTPCSGHYYFLNSTGINIGDPQSRAQTLPCQGTCGLMPDYDIYFWSVSVSEHGSCLGYTFFFFISYSENSIIFIYIFQKLLDLRAYKCVGGMRFVSESN